MRLALTVLVGLLAVPGWADPLYSSGPILGYISGSSIDGNNATVDKFTLLSASTVTGVSNIGLDVNYGNPNPPLSLSWFIADDSGANVALSTSFLEFELENQYDVYSASFSVDNLDLPAGTYVLELTNARVVGCPYGTGCVQWDLNNGPPTAASGGATGFSVSFEIDGYVDGSTPEPASTVPEPTGTVLVGIALVGLARLRNRRRPARP